MVVYFCVIFGHFYGDNVLKDHLYGIQCNYMQILFIKLVVYTCNIDLKIILILFERICRLIHGVFNDGYYLVKSDFYVENEKLCIINWGVNGLFWDL